MNHPLSGLRVVELAGLAPGTDIEHNKLTIICHSKSTSGFMDSLLC
jgi:hypothetical protein